MTWRSRCQVVSREAAARTERRQGLRSMHAACVRVKGRVEDEETWRCECEWKDGAKAGSYEENEREMNQKSRGIAESYILT